MAVGLVGASVRGKAGLGRNEAMHLLGAPKRYGSGMSKGDEDERL